MAVSHKGAISFGLVHIPVSLYTATQDHDIHFNQLCKGDMSRVRYKKVCAGCGKEVGPKDIIKGCEYGQDQYVVVTEEDFEKIKTEKDRSIQIMHFTDLSSIRPIYYDKTYHVLPDAGGEKAFELLRVAMKDQQKIGIAKTVMGQKETLMALIPTEDGMLSETMFYADEIKALPKEILHPQVKEAELEMAKTLIQSMDRPFEPHLYHDEYQKRLRQLIEQKIAGQEVVAARQEERNSVIDLMEALQRSIEQQAAAPAKGRRKKGA